MFKYGSDITKAICNGEYMDEEDLKPIYHEVESFHGELKKVKRPEIKICMEQDGYNLEYTEELENYNNKIMLYKENKHKAYALIFGFSNRVMQSWKQENSKFESKIRNDQ